MSATVVDNNAVEKIQWAVQGKMYPSQIRNLVKEVSGRDISTEQARGFLELFGDDLRAAVNEARRIFVKKHFGGR